MKKKTAAQVLHDWVVRLHVLFYLIKTACVCVGFYLCVSPDPGDSSRRWWVGISLPAEGRHLPVKLCCQHRYAGRPAAQPCAERSGGKNMHTHSTTRACTQRLSVCVCLGRCLNSTAPGSLSNELIQRLQMSRQTGLLATRGEWKGEEPIQ